MKFYYYAAWFNSTHQFLVTKKHGQVILKGKYNNSFSAFPSRSNLYDTQNNGSLGLKLDLIFIIGFVF